MQTEMAVPSILIDDEVLIIETSGEMPEVAYHGSIYYITSDPAGPRLSIGAEQLAKLKFAVVEGYRRIIFRDLNLNNRDKSIYRGLARCVVNWSRLENFCRTEGIDTSSLALEVCSALKVFLAGELADVRSGRPTSVNCSRLSLLGLAAKIGLDPGGLPQNWEIVFRED